MRLFQSATAALSKPRLPLFSLHGHKESEQKSQESSEALDGYHDKDIIELNILSAMNLNKADVVGSSDPYVVVYYNNKLLGKTSVKSKTLFPRWDNQVFHIEVPRDENNQVMLQELRLEVYDSNSSRDDVVLGCCYLDPTELASFLGIEQMNMSGQAESGNNITLRGPDWYSLGKIRTKTDIENKLATQGSLEISALYVPYYSVDHYEKYRYNTKSMGKLDLCVHSVNGLASLVASTVRSTMSTLRSQTMRSTVRGVSGIFGGAGGGAGPGGHKNSAIASLAATSSGPTSYCVFIWNGHVVGETQFIGPSNNPYFNEHCLVYVPLYLDIKDCFLEIEVYSEPAMKLAEPHFLGSIFVTGEDLVQLVSGKLDDYGDPEYSTFDLSNSDHHHPDDQVIQGTIDVRGEYEPYQSPSRVDVGWHYAYSPAMMNKWAKLRIIIVEASALAVTDPLGSHPNSYVAILLNGREVARTSTCKDSINPVWIDQSFDLTLIPSIALQDQFLEFKVFDVSRFGTITFLGEHALRGNSFQVCYIYLYMLVLDLLW